jgi:hypothetical protein
VRALVKYTVGCEDLPGARLASLGAILAALQADEARRFADLAAAYVAGTVTTTVDNDGHLVFEGTP